MKNEKWFALSVNEIEKKLKTNAASGLSRKAARSRASRNSGQLFYIPRRSPWKIVGDILLDFALILLILGAIFSLFFEKEELLRGVTILVIIIGNLLFCSLMYFRSQRMMESLSSFFYPTARVIRSGRLFSMDFRSVVVGDVILIEKGDILCCDARLVTSDKLRVNMRLNKEKFTLLDKFSDGHVDPKEIRASGMTNMVHAGSIVESGSARAIVTAVGQYTYLGAMTGGIPVPVSDKMPKLLERMKKQFSRINFISLIAVFPFCLISFILEKLIVGSSSVLSISFLTALALAATTMSQLICTLFKLYYTEKIRKLFTGKDAAVLRSVDTFDKISDADYVFMVDGCAVTDGILHFEAAISAEGELRNYNSLNKTTKTLAEYTHLYYKAATNTLSTGISGAGNYFDGIKEFVDKSGVDTEALKYRCSIISYTSGNLRDIPEKIYFADGGVRMCLVVSRSSSFLKKCNFSMYGGTKHPLGGEGVASLEKLWASYEAQGKKPLAFALSPEAGSVAELCFVGLIVLGEGIDKNIVNNLKTLDRLGCKVISFADNDSNSPSIPIILRGNGCVSREDFIRNRLPVHYNFGSINSYYGLTDNEILGLISLARSKNKKVMVMGFTKRAEQLSRQADGFISCANISPSITGYLKEEINAAELAGQQGSHSCTQTVKDSADCLIPRPKKEHGGLASLVSLFRAVKSVRCNISDSLRYLICTNIITVIMVALPLLFGEAILDARHVMLGAFVLNIFAFFAFMKRNNSFMPRRKKDYCEAKGIMDYFIGDADVLVSSIASSLCAILLPFGLDLIIGDYDYPTEVLFTSFLLLYFVAFVMIYYCDDYKQLKYAYKNKIMIFELLLIIVIWGLCVCNQSIGVLLGIDGFMSLPYFLVSFVPSAVFVLLFLFFRSKRKVSF